MMLGIAVLIVFLAALVALVGLKWFMFFVMIVGIACAFLGWPRGGPHGGGP